MCNGSSFVQGESRIVDNAGRKMLPTGVESFGEIASRFVYVDKTLVLREMIDRGGVTLFCRPRRFGKSTCLRMMRAFFEAPVKGYVDDGRDLFSNLAIWDEDELYRRECGAHPVIFLSMGSCAQGSYDDTVTAVAQQVSDEYLRHSYLLDDDWMLALEKARYERIAAGEARPQELRASLNILSRLLCRHHGSKVVILIDEYDNPINDGYEHGYRPQILNFYRSWLTDALKGTDALYCSALTGVLRVSQESIFSELNNVRVDTTLDNQYGEAFGFTEPEAEALARYVGRGNSVEEMRAWYDGYRFGDARVYNPWSVLNYLQGGVAQPYWVNTSNNGIVRKLVGRADEDVTVELAALSSGGVVRKPLDLRTVFDDLDDNPWAVWAQMYQAGYVTTEDTGFSNDSRRQRALRVPNLEVGELFSGELLDRATRMAGSKASLDALHTSLVGGDSAGLSSVLRRILLESASYFDLTDEGRYHTLMLGLLYAVPGYKPATSSRESGDGRCDVLLEPLSERVADLPVVAMELKRFKAEGSKLVTDEDLMLCAHDVALAQAKQLNYGYGMGGKGCVLWGVAFFGKRVACVCEDAQTGAWGSL